jgi:hypothetical protein
MDYGKIGWSQGTIPWHQLSINLTQISLMVMDETGTAAASLIDLKLFHV